MIQSQPIVSSEHRFISFDETPIFYRRYKTTARPKGIVIIQHGMGEHGGRYGHVASFLAPMGIETISMDLRGFGLSGGKRAYVRSFSDYLADLEGLHNYINRTEEGVPVFLLGHSFGGLIASFYLALRKHQKINGLILSSPIFGVALTVPGWRHTLGVVAAVVFPALTQKNQIKPPMLTHDEEVLADYKKDSLIYPYVSARLYRELVLALKFKNRIADRLIEPVMIMQAGLDYVVSRRATTDFYQRLKAEDKKLIIYEEFYHEILNETGRQKVLTDMAEWLLKKIDDK